jgi:hypothetical protein
MDKMLTIAITLMAAGLSYIGFIQCYEETAPIWIAMTWFGGFFSAVLGFNALKE